jgi:hypothetical protein
MFLLHCDHCGRRELRGPRSLSTDEHGAFAATCRMCGTTNVVAGGHRVPLTPPAPTPVPTAA